MQSSEAKKQQIEQDIAAQEEAKEAAKKAEKEAKEAKEQAKKDAEALENQKKEAEKRLELEKKQLEEQMKTASEAKKKELEAQKKAAEARLKAEKERLEKELKAKEAAKKEAERLAKLAKEEQEKAEKALKDKENALKAAKESAELAAEIARKEKLNQLQNQTTKIDSVVYASNPTGFVYHDVVQKDGKRYELSAVGDAGFRVDVNKSKVEYLLRSDSGTLTGDGKSTQFSIYKKGKADKKGIEEDILRSINGQLYKEDDHEEKYLKDGQLNLSKSDAGQVHSVGFATKDTSAVGNAYESSQGSYEKSKDIWEEKEKNSEEKDFKKDLGK